LPIADFRENYLFLNGKDKVGQVSVTARTLYVSG